MIGFLVKHRQLGLGKVESIQNRAFSIRFISSGQMMPFGVGQFGADGSLRRDVLGIGSRCKTPRGECVIESVAKRPGTPAEPYLYSVSLQSGDSALLSESDLEPIPGGESADPEARLAGSQLHPYLLFSSRERLRREYARLLREASGLRSLLGSRVDLRPHQAFVAGTILLEPRRRFILADEVGLGKTIEAGIVIHDLLAQRPDARILVLCPESLTQQWLCELYAKFGGQLFTLLDLHESHSLDWSRLRRAIGSTALAALEVGPKLENVSWDMVVVDEAHHLLTTPRLYDLVERISCRAPSVLLLSAIPAHERSDELLRLLILLEPEKFGNRDSDTRQWFATLHEQQPAIGKGLRVLDRRIAALETGQVELVDACKVGRLLLETRPIDGDLDLAERLGRIEALAAEVPPVFVQDRSASSSGQAACLPTSEAARSPVAFAIPLNVATGSGAQTSEQSGLTAVDADELTASSIRPALPKACGDEQTRQHAAHALRLWAHDLADRYRLSRRILRNRRSRLIEQGQIAAIERRLELHPYAAHWLEADASDALERLLRVAFENHKEEQAGLLLRAFARVAWQSQSSPAALSDLLSALQRARPAEITPQKADFIAIGNSVGYADWSRFRDVLLRGVRGYLPEEELAVAVETANAWCSGGPEACRRLSAVRELILPLSEERPKLLLFAGHPGLAEEVCAYLASHFGTAAVASFLAEQSMEEKEACVIRFQQDPSVWLLVSDESGGEGRNFQFASAVIHIDTPWHVARVEQRIGRLDRLGRERVSSDVVSHVIYNDASVEAGLVQHFDQGLAVYHRSLSGLEFALREAENLIISSALTGGLDALLESVPALTDMATAERARDDADSVLDEASYEGSAAAKFRAITRSSRTEEALEAAMYAYMRQLTEARGARKLDSAYGQGAVIRFQPERTCFGALPVDGTGAEFLAGNFDGTFRRAVAQQDPSLRFFGVSDPLFNAVVGSLERQATGRTYALEVNSPGKPPWVGLECRFVPKADDRLFDASPGLRNRLDALFIPKPIAVFVDLEGSILGHEEAEAIVRLRRRLEFVDQGRTWWDLLYSVDQLAFALDPDVWPKTVSGLLDVARGEALRRIAEELDHRISAERQRLSTIIELLSLAGDRGDSDARQQAAEYSAFQTALPTWGIGLDSVGIVSVNGRLRLGRLA